MAAQGGMRDKILRVSMPFEKGRISKRKSTKGSTQKLSFFGSASDPLMVILRVWALSAASRLGLFHVTKRHEKLKSDGRRLRPQIRELLLEQDSISAEHSKDGYFCGF